MPERQQSTLESSGIEWPIVTNRIPRTAPIIQLLLGPGTSSLGVKGPNISCEAHHHNQQLGENENIDIGRSQRLRKRSMLNLSWDWP
jgi:hypothetical protein